MPAPPSTVVVVEDDASLRDAIERLLRAAGFDPRTFDDAPALLQSDAATIANCLVLDVHLPAFSGFELHRRLISTGIRSPVVFITAHDEPATRQQADSVGAAAYLSKPFAGRTLVEAITLAIAEHRH